MAMRFSLVRSIAASPWSSTQDAVLAVSVLATGLLLAIEFDLFHFMHELTAEEQQISLLEAIGLTLLLAFCIIGFVIRRVQEAQNEAQRRADVDVTMRELRDQAMRDSLTNLPNRRAVIGRLEELRPQEDGRQHAFFLLDLNRFKSVNDGYGHGAGDRVLQVIAERFKRVARPTDLLARLGGDEFAVLAYDIDYAGAVAVGNRYLAVLENKIWVDGIGHEIGVSIGCVFVPGHCSAGTEILANADLAMYRAKASNQSMLVFYSELDQGRGLSRA